MKTYQLVGEYSFGTQLKIAPISTNEFLNRETCLQVNGSADSGIEVQSLLPVVKNFTLIGSVDCSGKKCDKFQLSETIGQKKNVYTLLVTYVKSPKYPAALQPIPVRYEMRGYNSLIGSHIDHYYLDYDYYNHDDIPNEVFEIEVEKCQGFPGPGNAHTATMNPMKEFVFPHDSQHVDTEFERFKKKHNKDYDSHHEHENRKNIFTQNLRFVHSKNRARLSYSLGINHLADRTADELKALRGFKSSQVYNGGQAFPYTSAQLKRIADHLPDSKDWRIDGAVTPVKDQSVCGSCWSFGSEFFFAESIKKCIKNEISSLPQQLERSKAHIS